MSSDVLPADPPEGFAASRPLRVVALVKQVPMAESFHLGDDGRLVRAGLPLEMNPYCRRAVAKGVELARLSGGTCVVATMGPAEAEDVLREAVAWGADRAVHLCDEALAGSDTLATARALAALVATLGEVDLVLVGRNSVDGDTGQVGPEIAQLLDRAFAPGVRILAGDLSTLRLRLEVEDGIEDVEVTLPAVLSVAERLCDPAKVAPEGRAAVDGSLIERVDVDRLRTQAEGAGFVLPAEAWGEKGSPTRVGAVRTVEHHRRPEILGSSAADVQRAVSILVDQGALARPEETDGGPTVVTRSGASNGRPVAVLVEADQPQVAAELLGAAAELASEIGSHVVAVGEDQALANAADLAGWGADAIVELRSGSSQPTAEEDLAHALGAWADAVSPWAVLAPSTEVGRQVAGRAAALLGAGLVGDAISLEARDGRLVAAKPAFAGAVVADVTCTTDIQMATVRPGVLPLRRPRRAEGEMAREVLVRAPRGRVRRLGRQRDDDLEALARAEVVIGVGTGVDPAEYPSLEPLVAALGAELAATRKVTDRGWMPRGRQVGITGRSISPRLYVAIGVGGKFNHMVGVRAAGSVLAVNADREAPVFDHVDVGIVGDWHDVIEPLGQAIAAAAAGPPGAAAR